MEFAFSVFHFEANDLKLPFSVYRIYTCCHFNCKIENGSSGDFPKSAYHLLNVQKIFVMCLFVDEKKTEVIHLQTDETDLSIYVSLQ
jgi:hypothetical protein